MTDQQEDHWGHLADDLGAEPNPEANEPEKTPEHETPAAPDSPPAFDVVKSKSIMKPQQESGWGDLADTLGIETDDAAPPAEEETPEPPAEPTPEVAESMTEHREPAEQEVIDSDVTEIGMAVTSTETIDPATEPASEPSRDRPREPSGRRRRRRSSGRRSEAEQDESAPPEDFAGDIEQIDAAVEFEPTDPSDADDAIAASDEDLPRTEEDDASPESEEGRQRRRRRRRGRRGSRRDESSESDAGASSESGDGDSEVGDAEPETSGSARSDSDRRGGQEKRPTHRNIPTWDDAVGIVVGSNMESRSRTTKPSGRGRGRGRGGRGRPRPSGPRGGGDGGR